MSGCLANSLQLSADTEPVVVSTQYYYKLFSGVGNQKYELGGPCISSSLLPPSTAPSSTFLLLFPSLLIPVSFSLSLSSRPFPSL